MREGSPDEPLKLPAWLIGLCKWCWHRRDFFFGTVLFSVLLNIVAALPLVDPSTLRAVPIAWVFSFWPLCLAIFAFFLLWTLFCGLVARLGAPLSVHGVHHTYLSRVVGEQELATLQGIPAGLIAQSVRLADIFIAPQFRLNRPLVDFPLSEQELEQYRQSLKRSKVPSTDLERVVFEAEKNWQHLMLQSDKVGIAAVWKRLERDKAVVIQGYPGMGKSTLIERLTLYMATRGLKRADPAMPEQEHLTPLRLPVLLRLGEYAIARTELPALSLHDYLVRVMEERRVPGLPAFLQKALQDGSCLVMLDGLDEVSEASMREQLREQIKVFVQENGANRFLITSRVAGYEQGAFPAYPHFTLAELNEQQIQDFLPRWCCARLAWDRGIGTAAVMQQTSLAQEVRERVETLTAALQNSPGVQKLAENPLLLTLLVVMQQNSVVLPRQRVELYDVVTRTLLENRNIAKHLKPVSEFQAIQRLGPLAFQMQETNNSLARRHEVEQELLTVILQAGGTDAEGSSEMQNFLRAVRERGGLFALRVGDYFGFIHRTFQEYFAARFILNNIKLAQQEWIDRLVERACRQDALWREPFLLAVAYQSRENELIANAILRSVLERDEEDRLEQEVYNVVLAAEAMIEAKELTIDALLQTQAVSRLLGAYRKALHRRALGLCQQIENSLLRWLLSLPKEVYRSPLLAVITQVLSNSETERPLQCATLTLLAQIASRLEHCSAIVFETLLPLLLALSGLPAVGLYRADAGLSSGAMDVAYLAFSVLLFLQRRGPNGLYLAEMQRHFADHPAQLRLLARASLECQTLITPTFVPLTETNYRCYEAAIGQWVLLRDSSRQGITEQRVEACLAIHKTLLACAEEANYPLAVHLLAMLHRATHQADRPWSQVWQRYLLEQMENGEYLSYQQAIYLWNALFPGVQLHPLVQTLLSHATTAGSVRQSYARRFFASFAYYWLYLSDMQNLRDMGEWMGLSDLRYPRYNIFTRYSRYLRYPAYLRNLNTLRYLRYLMELKDLRYLNLNDLQTLMGLSDLRNLSYWRDLLDMSRSVSGMQTLQAAYAALIAADASHARDLLLICEAWLLQVQLDGHSGPEIERETRQVADAVGVTLARSAPGDTISTAALDVLCALPARTFTEICLLRHLAEQSADPGVQTACAIAIRFARPLTAQAWQAIAGMLASPVAELVEVAGQVMRRKPL
jgi:nucleoside-triphosphatase THEP1